MNEKSISYQLGILVLLMVILAKYSISCCGVGVPDSDFEVKSASSEQELFEILTVHAKRGHNMQEIPPDKVQAAKKAMVVH